MKIINQFLEESSNYQLYVDMDGVLVDWDKMAKSILGMSADEFQTKYGAPKMWAILNRKGVAFWSDMDWMPDGKKLWTFLAPYKPIILSKPTRDKNSRIGKKIWIEKHIGKGTPYILEREKAKYADKSSILIDDQLENIYPWKRAGGIGILHKNTNDTIGRLKNILR